MTRTVSLQMYLTLDGYNEFPTYPGSNPANDEPDPIAEEMWIKRWDSIDVLLFDPQTYGEWADFWPLEKRTPDEHPWFRQMSEFSERVEKIVLGERPSSAVWSNTRYVPGEVGEAVRGLKMGTGGTIATVAPKLGMDLSRRGLIDDYFFAVMPVILGKGRKFFEELEHQRTLRLVEVKSFPAGELFLHYQATSPE